MIQTLIVNSPFFLTILDTLKFFGGVGILFFQINRDLWKGPIYWKLFIEQIFQVGNRSLPLIVITAISTGMVMSLQFGLGLEKFGGKLYVPKLVSIIVLREMGPVFTALMVAARVGAGFASEIGSMVVTQQIDAMRALGTSPIKKIVIPRVLATLVSLPLLVAISNIVSNFGALIVGYSELKLDPNFYVLKILTTVTLMDYFSGIGKSFFFAIFIAVPSCYFGLTVKNGTKEVGTATTKAVVVSSILVLVGNFFLAKLFLDSGEADMIEVKNFRKSFGNKEVHRGINFTVGKGECMGLIGGSGVGKSVILRSLIGLERPDSGQIIIDGVDITSLKENDLVSIRKKVAYVFQGGALFDSMTVFENLAYPLKEHTQMSDVNIKKFILDQLAEFGLPNSENLFPSNLSGGMQKRVGLARALMMQPQVILYDEPTAGLDPYNTKKIQNHILKLKATGITSILVTHDMPTAFAVCDKMSFILDGKIAFEGKLNEIQEDKTGIVSKFINGDAH